jgi:hypothetical protein
LGARRRCGHDDEPADHCPQSNREQFGTLLNEGLARHTPALLAAQRPALDLGEGDYRPELDVGLIDADYDAD